MTYVFGDCELDPQLRELRRSGAVCAVEPQVFDLLLYLIENRDRMVGKDELNERIWKGRFVSDASLSTSIKLARQAIGDSGKRQDYIRTLPRRGFRFVASVEVQGSSSHAVVPAASGAGVEPAGPEQPKKPSIAVLPFGVMSGDPDQEYFADGITENIITLLSKYRWLFVIARSSSFRYKGTAPDIRQVGQDLGVRYVLEGSVRKVGDRVRVATRLIDASNGSYIWTENYDRNLKDLFVLQDDIARQISACLEPEIERAEWRSLKRGEDPNLSAWDQYLRGSARMHEYSREGNAAAKAYLTKAIELEPELARAHAAMAYVIYHDIADGYVEFREQALREAEQHARTATTIDSQDAFAHCILGRVFAKQSRFDEAIMELKTAIGLNPSLALAYHGLAYALYYSGDAEQSIALFETAEKLSPHDHNVWAFLGIRAQAYIQLGNYDAAVRVAREAVRKPHAKYWADVALVSALGHADKNEEARRALDELLRRKPDLSAQFIRKHLGFMKYPVQLEHFIDGLRKAGLPEE